MKKKLTAWLLVLAMAVSAMPMAFAVNEPTDTVSAEAASVEVETTGGVASITTLTSGALDGTNISVATTADIPEGAEVIEITEASEAAQQELAAAEAAGTAINADGLEPVQQLYTTETENEEYGEYTTTSFSNYGSQLSELVYVVTNSTYGTKTYVRIGNTLENAYNKVMADLAKGTNSVIFKNVDADDASYYSSSVRNLGVSFTFPSSISSDMREAILKESSWILYRCVDFDSTDMFFSNGYAYYAYSLSGTTGKIWVAPVCYKGFETLTQRKNLKSKLDAQVNEIISEAAEYSTAYDKIKYFHDWLCLHNEYNTPAANSSSYSTSISGAPWSSVGALLSHTGAVVGPVCESYSRALQVLCKKAGITATVITSDQGCHMWSNLRYGQKWTGIDVTWDDGTGADYDYSYFMNRVNNCDYYHVVDDEYFIDWFEFPALSVVSSWKELPFYDVTTGFWGEDYIEYCYQNGYMSGMNCVTFGISTPVTRAQFAVILYSIEGKPSVKYKSTFKDVPRGQWYTDAVLWANQEGIASGYASGYFGINDQITREQMALMLYKYMDGQPSSKDYLEDFSDVGKVSSWAYDAMNWAVRNGVISGNANGTLDPLGKATRTQCAVMITNIMENIA